MSDITVRLFYRERQIFTIEVSIFRQETEETRPFIRDEGTDAVVDTINKLFYRAITTSADLPAERFT